LNCPFSWLQQSANHAGSCNFLNPARFQYTEYFIFADIRIVMANSFNEFQITLQVAVHYNGLHLFLINHCNAILFESAIARS
jgi:hypothetical protein